MHGTIMSQPSWVCLDSAAFDGGGAWVVWDGVDGFEGLVSDITLDGILPEKLCVRVATFPDHTLESLDSGNCIPIIDNS